MIVRVQIPPLPPNHKCHTSHMLIQIHATANIAALEPKTQLLFCKFINMLSAMPRTEQQQLHDELEVAFTEILKKDI